jgi:hypothetical protein
VPINARRSIDGVTGPDAAPSGRAVLRRLPARPARTNAEASGGTVSSSVTIMKHGGLLDAAESAGPKSEALPSRARPNHRCRRTESGRPRMPGDSGRKPRDPRDERRVHMRWWLDAPGNTPGWSPAGDSRGRRGPEPLGHGRAWRDYRSRTAPRGPVRASSASRAGATSSRGRPSPSREFHVCGQAVFSQDDVRNQ